MQLTNLRSLFSQMKSQNLSLCIFQFCKNKVDFDIYFDIESVPFQIGFIAKLTTLNLWFPIEKGFVINTHLKRMDYDTLCNMLNLQPDINNRFYTNSFFEEFNRNIPLQLPKQEGPSKEMRRALTKKYSLEDPESIYYLGCKDWDIPKNRGKGNRTPENLEKTKHLYPQIYERTKDRNISILYSPRRNDNILGWEKHIV